MPVDDSTFAPKFAIEVNDTPVDDNVAPFIRHVEYESVDGMADLGRLRLINPNNIISNAKLFQPGNEVSLYFGYGKNVALTHVGRIIIQKAIPYYPQEGTPTIQVIGYSKDTQLMNSSPEESEKRQFKDTRYSDAVRDSMPKDYRMLSDVDVTPDEPHDFIHKAGLSDYDFIRGLANITGFVFWVDFDVANERWKLHFKNPATLKEQDKTYTFEYNNGDLSSLLSFRPELLIKDAKTKIVAVSKDRESGRIIRTAVEEQNDNAPEMDATGDETGEIKGEYTTASDIVLYFGDFAFEVVTHKQFDSPSRLTAWVEQWFRRQRENFILSQGRVIGIETLMARQTHIVEGIGTGYDGEYYMTKVKHIANDSVGYVNDFAARKVVP